ncbi:MAG: cadmium-translocating P-type ATPase [Candidatus Hydrogenedentes bacterium]|nr:cadmium-translocating P-type ATPase [Candidatus Hydrogenedentota bacterium]
MQDYAFKIRGMDCAEEVAILKRELGPGFGEENLRFDVMNGKLIVASEDGGTTRDKVVELVRKTGMEAIPWDKHVSQAKNGDSFWARRGRTILTVLSGVCIFLGFVWHSTQHGILDALTGGEAEIHQFPLSVIILYVVGIVSGGWFIFPKAWYAARRLRPDMNLLMTVAVIGAVTIGEWFEAAVVTVLFGIALLLESWSVGRARRAISALMDLSPPTAMCVTQTGNTEQKPVAEVDIGSHVMVRPGERVPLDGVVTKGSTTVNQAPITGESKPVPKEVGDEVFAGSINEEGAFEFRTTKAPADTTIARIIRMVEEAQSRRAPSEQWVEWFARYYTPLMMGLSVLVMIVPPIVFGGAWGTWFYQGLVLLVIACPCALVISTPVSIVAGLSSAARAGVLIKGGIFLEAPARLRAIAMDKTGTLTRGQPEVQMVVPLSGHSAHELLERAAALESQSEHPLARAILRQADAAGVHFAPAEQFQAIKGKGAQGYINGRLYWIGSHRFLHELGEEEDRVHEEAQRLEDAGHSVIVVGNDTHVCGLISVADAVRPEAKDIVLALKDAGIQRVVMLTGDNNGTAEAIAGEVGVDDAEAELLPEDKVEAVQRLVTAFGSVAMVGDGINDAPALAAASVGIAMGAAGTDAALETADIALMSDDLSKLPWLIEHSKRTLRIIRQNIIFALGLKAVFILLSLAGMATLWMAIAADMGASLLVIFNGLRLLRSHFDIYA